MNIGTSTCIRHIVSGLSAVAMTALPLSLVVNSFEADRAPIHAKVEDEAALGKANQPA